MNSTKKTTDYVTSLLLLTFLVVSITNLPVLAQESQGSIIPGPWGKKVFLFLHTAAKALGEFLIFVISKLMGEKLSGLV
ncbi:hypothetical protein KGY79_10445, partial [Candidatus Bipolaricaulota bacterium]|nr:hypothetical protein [Candidatus Bipolaricaulota bacterium]